MQTEPRSLMDSELLAAALTTQLPGLEEMAGQKLGSPPVKLSRKLNLGGSVVEANGTKGE